MACEIDFAYDGCSTCALDESQITHACDVVLAAEDVTRPCFLSVTIVSDDRMRELNAEWRGQDRATDVLSIECERPDDVGLAAGEPCELGDLVLAPDYIARQAKSYGTTVTTETTLLLVHGLLHLLGYDHLEEEEAGHMEEREDHLVSLILGEGVLASATLTRHRKGVDE
jgi:probable rRNA maturation factor